MNCTQHGPSGQLIPSLQYVNGWRLTVMGVSLPITSLQAKTIWLQLQEMIALREVA